MSWAGNSASADVIVHYHQEGNGTGWWGSVDGWSWSCTGETLDECRGMAREGIPFCIDERLQARSVMFMQIFETSFVAPAASEAFRLYVPEDAP